MQGEQMAEVQAKLMAELVPDFMRKGMAELMSKFMVELMPESMRRIMAA